MTSSDKRSRGVSRSQWLDEALEVVRVNGIAAVTVQGLARSLGIAKAGFYWHFKDRDDLLRQLLDHWAHETTEVLSDNEQVRELEPRERLIRIADTIAQYELAQYDLPIRQWALQDASAARVVRRVNRARTEAVGHAFAELGFEGDDLEMRTMLFVGYHSTEVFMLPDVSRKRRRQLIAKRIELLTSK